VLPLPDPPRDLLGQPFGAHSRVAENEVAHRVVDDLLEARHVHAPPRGAELDETLEPGREQLRRAPIDADVDDFLYPREPDPRQRHADGRQRRLDVHRLGGG
jgi:hypothetical protein